MEYNKDGIIVRKSTLNDCVYLADHMRQADIDEIWASHHASPYYALSLCWRKSPFCYTVERERRPVAIFGIYPVHFIGTDASVWMLATDEICLIRKRFARHSRQIVKRMLELYPFLYNYVDVRNEESIKWLLWCGAKLRTPEPYGMDKQLFHHFEFRRT